ncbi:hypothetical protein [Subtercola sp. YIM 133946]|uniref:hypothetical protein n=1 Tax=Subtercola sp. YIM 133946 TaxID=3118909 RepID=UPI002F9331FA
MLNGNPTLADIELPDTVDNEVTFCTSHSSYALRNSSQGTWHLVRIERLVPRVTHLLHVRGHEWVAAPVDAGRNVHSPDWRDALRRVIT